MKQHAGRFPHLIRILPWAVIVVASVIFFSPFLFQGKVFLPADTLYANYPWKSLVPRDFRPHNPLLTDPVNHNWAGIYNRQLHEGALKNWNPYLMTGTPNTGVTAMSGMSGRWYPLKLLLHRLFDAATALSLLLLTHVTLMGLTMFLFLKEIGAGRRGALFGAVAYMFNGVAMVWLEYESVVAASALLPLLVLCLERLSGRRRHLHAFLGAGVLGMMWLMGHLQYMVYTFLLICFYLLFLAWRMRREKAPLRGMIDLFLCFVIVVVLGTGIGAIEILPTLELVRNSAKLERGYGFGELFAAVGRIPFRQLVGLVFPDYFGSPLLPLTSLPTPPSQKLMMYGELSLYIGIPTLFAFLAAVVSFRNLHARFFILLALLTALMMAGTFVYYPFFKVIPGMDKMTPTRVVWLFTFSAIAAASFGIRSLRTFTGTRRRLFMSVASLLTAGISLLALLSDHPSVVTFFNAEQLAGTAASAGLQDALASLRHLSSKVILLPLLMTFLSFGLFCVLVTVRKWRHRLVIYSAILALLGFELIGTARRFNTVVEPGTIYPRTPGIDFLLGQPKPFRVLVDLSLGMTSVNTMAPFLLEEVGGYSSVYPGNVNTLMSYIQWGGRTPERYDRWVILHNLQSPLYDLLNTKYFLMPPRTQGSDPRLRLVYRGDDMDIFENKGVMPRVFVVHSAVSTPDDLRALRFMDGGRFDMRREVVLSEDPDPAFLRNRPPVGRPPVAILETYEPDTVSVAAELSSIGWLVLSDTWYPGWKSFVDGVETPVVRANVNFRAVPLKAGRHRVIFRYMPSSLRWGKMLTILGAMLVMGGIFGTAFLGRRSPPGLVINGG